MYLGFVFGLFGGSGLVFRAEELQRPSGVSHPDIIMLHRSVSVWYAGITT